MTRPHLVLASASTTRLRVLRQAGFDPAVQVSDVDESVVAGLDAPSAVALLAERKARAVASSFPDSLVLGCDSLVLHDGAVLGKPSSPTEAREWWRSMRRSTVVVWTGQCLAHHGVVTVRTTSARVHIGDVRDEEIDAYVRHEEPMQAAGAFKLDGLAAAFIDTIEGDPGTVHGVSVGELRSMLSDAGVEVHELWR
ncbi:MAG TPA: Maf family protein [Acidimicrobiales bacterium]|nr:Maf family protein [Acidimicrobiales bacterium]